MLMEKKFVRERKGLPETQKARGFTLSALVAEQQVLGVSGLGKCRAWEVLLGRHDMVAAKTHVFTVGSLPCAQTVQCRGRGGHGGCYFAVRGPESEP